jgi:hypothetical protein
LPKPVHGVALACLWITAAHGATPPPPERFEPGGTPVLTYSSDIGLGFGALGTLARFRPGCEPPFCWRVEVLAMASVKDDHGIGLPYHDDHVRLDLPGLAGGRLRLAISVGFGRYLTSGYYGLGNASTVDEKKLAASSRYHQYDRIYPQIQARARINLQPHLQLMLGGSFTYNWINLYEDSLLAEEAASPDPRLRELLRGTGDHGIAQLDLGWVWDTRDHEYAPTRGGFHEISWRSSPDLSTSGDLAYGGVNLTTRFFVPLWRPRLVLALRLMADLLVGQPPFYELALHGGLTPTSAIGGEKAVRGVPQERYYGKAKLLGNLELRARLLPFRIKSQRFVLGAVLFADTGRVWADYSDSERFDGKGIGLKVGTGGGLRLRWGETFILRGDLAWSPDADPVGFYIDINHIF